MDIEEFWMLIEQTKKADLPNDQGKEQATLLLDQLLSRSVEEILDFNLLFEQLFVRAKDWHLWEAMYLMECYGSDDHFDYFRAWLIGQGKVIFENALADPESLADVVDVGVIAQAEVLLSVADEAYQQKTGQEYIVDVRTHILQPLRHSEDKPEEQFNDEWEDALAERYPKLHAKFKDCESWDFDIKT
jgi:hypothetical protein